MKQVLSVLLGLSLTFAAGMAHAQATGGTVAAPMARDQVKIERDEYMRTHRWDPIYENWVLKPEFEAPAGMKSRAEIKAMRDEFLRNNRWDPVTASWSPVGKAPRDLGKLSRAQVKDEGLQFTRTHRWDEPQSAWVEITPRAPKAKK